MVTVARRMIYLASIYLCAQWAMSVWTVAAITEMTMEDNDV